MNKILPLFICLFLFSCGYLDNDGNSFEEIITGKFVVIQDKTDTDKSFDLRFKTTDGTSGTYSGILDNCKKIICDTVSNKIYIQKSDYADNPAFNEIMILDLKTDNFIKAFKIKEITKEKFETAAKSCENCIIKNY